jgi:hypothetical protein
MAPDGRRPSGAFFVQQTQYEELEDTGAAVQWAAAKLEPTVLRVAASLWPAVQQWTAGSHWTTVAGCDYLHPLRP